MAGAGTGSMPCAARVSPRVNGKDEHATRNSDTKVPLAVLVSQTSASASTVAFVKKDDDSRSQLPDYCCCWVVCACCSI